MGKPIIAQRRGKGSAPFRSNSFNHTGMARVLSFENALVTNIVPCRGHSAPLVQLYYDTGDEGYAIAPEGVSVGDLLDLSKDAKVQHGNFLRLADIPEGVAIFNIEQKPLDGGKFVRASGASARIISKSKEGITVQMPSRKSKIFNPNCKAMIGVVAGGGRVEKPFLKAGKKFHAMKAKSKYWPSVSASAMNAVAHPFGNKRTARKSKATPPPKNAPPGRRVGAIRARKTGRAKGKRV